MKPFSAVHSNAAQNVASMMPNADTPEISMIEMQSLISQRAVALEMAKAIAEPMNEATAAVARNIDGRSSENENAAPSETALFKNDLAAQLVPEGVLANADVLVGNTPIKLNASVNELAQPFAGTEWGQIFKAEGVTILGDKTDNHFVGGGGDDNIGGLGGNDILSGQGGDDTLRGGAGTDTLYGGDGDDILEGFGQVTGDLGPFYTDDGNNHLTGGNGADQITGGGGFDTAHYENSTEGVSIFLGEGDTSGWAHTGEAEGDVLSSIEGLVGSQHDDLLVGNERGNSLEGKAGGDTLSGHAGNDTLSGGFGDDVLIGGSGNDSLAGGGGADRFVFGADNAGGKDTVTDFNEGAGDTIDMRGFESIDSFADLTITTDRDGNAVVSYGDQSITLKDVAPEDLDGSEFEFGSYPDSEGDTAAPTPDGAVVADHNCWQPLPDLNEWSSV